MKPYFMSLRVNDFRRVTIQSNMGVAATEDIQEGRTLTPQIRVGNPRLDNFKLITQGAANTQGRDIAPWVLPMNDNDVEGIRAGIWSEVRRRYDFAVNVYRETQAKVSTNVADEDTAACFSVAPVEQYYEQPLTAEQKKIDIEANILSDLTMNHILPEATRYQSILLDNVSKMKDIFSNKDFDSVASGEVQNIKDIAIHMSEARRLVAGFPVP